MMSTTGASSMTGREEASLSVQGLREGLPPPPRAAWMWKPRSKLTDNDGNAKHATSLLQLRRIGARHWNRRFVFLDHHLFCYGKDKGRKDKQVPFELIETVRRETQEKLRREHAPKEYAGFGWYLAVKGRTLLFCAESEESAAQWVDYLSALLCAMRGSPASTLPGATPAAASAAVLPGATPEAQALARGTTLAELGALYDQAHPNDETHNGALTSLMSPGETLTDEASMLTPGERPRRLQSSLTVNPTLPPSAEPESSTTRNDGREEPADPATGRPPVLLTNSSISSQTSAAVITRTLRQTSRHHTNVGEEVEARDDIENNDDDAHTGVSLLDVSSEDTEGEDSSDGDEGGADRHARARASVRPPTTPAPAADEALQEHGAGERPLPREVRYARFLLPLAADPHSHIGYRIPALESHFKSGDDAGGVTFSRTMEKVGKRDNAQTREVVLTTRQLYLFSKGGMANSQQVRCINTHDITGVVESTTDKALIAVLVPTFHDILLKVVPQNSCVPGAPAEVKQQFIAHLYKAHCDVHTEHRFLFRESASVAKEIRRTEEAKFPPLTVRAGDQMRVGERVALLETFAKNADESVYWSSMVRQVQADRKPRLCALVVTESSIYTLSDTLQEVEHRTFIRDFLHVEYDRDAQSILLQCRGVDVLFNMQSSVEFDDFLSVLPTAVADGFGRTLRLTPSKQLYSHAKLFSLSTLSGVGMTGAARSAARRHRGFLWSKGKKSGGGTKLLSSFAAAADENADDDGDVEAFHNSIQGDYRNSQAIRLFCAQFRFVEEVLQDYDDAVALWQQYEASSRLPCWDTLRLRNTFVTRMRVGEICLSAACRLLDTKECATLAKASALELHESVVKGMGTPRAVCITSEGFLFLRDGVAAASSATARSTSGSGEAAFAAPSSLSSSTTTRNKVKNRLSVAVSQISSGVGGGSMAGKDDDMILGLIGWSSIAAVVRCHSMEGSSVAVLTNRTHPVDYLFHLGSAQTMLDVMTAAMGCYAQFRHGNPDHTYLLPLYCAPRVQNLAVALKKTVFDPFPTVALRYTPHSFHSDRLRMAFIPDVADACRRFGDNTIHFSGVAWRVRSATLRKCGGHLEEDPGADMRRQNNHLYKSYIFVLTNVAVYHCTKGGFEVVRRTLLTDVKGITVSLEDPDTVMLSVPSEYDMYFRIEGRGAEVVARLQEAYVEWTNYGHYLPFERQGSHKLTDFGLPVRHAPCVASLGTLTKPAYFNDLQSSRPAAECRHQTQQWHLRCLKRAIASLERAQAAARKERRPSSAAGGPQWSTWNRVRAALAERQSFLYFVQRRCFRFGLVSEDFDEMQRAQRLLRSYSEMEKSASALIAATSSTDPDVFQAALQCASVVPDLRLLVEEETRIYEGYLARRACLNAIFSAVQRYGYRANRDGVSLVALEATLLDLLAEARRVGFHAAFLRYIVHVVRVVVQRTQLQRVVCDPANQRRLSLMQDGGWVLVQQAAGEVGMTWRRPATAASAARSRASRLQLNVRVAHVALKRSAMTGEPALIRGATALAVSVLEAWEADKAKLGIDAASRAKESDTAVSALRSAVQAVQDGCTQPQEEERHLLLRSVEALITARQRHQRQQTWTLGIVKKMLSTCVELEEQVAAESSPFGVQYNSCTQSVLATEHAMLAEQQHRLLLRQALENRELKAQRQHERELQKRRLATQRAAAHRQRREATMRERRQRKALTLWGSQVDQLVSKLDAVLADAEGETDESIRLSIKRCVHLQRWIAEAGARYGLTSPQASPSSSPVPLLPSLSAIHTQPLASSAADPKGEKALAELLKRLQSVAARAQRFLDRRARGGADLYGQLGNSSRASATGANSLSFNAADSQEGDASTGTAPLTLPAEVEQLIATLNTQGVVAYIQEHQGSTDTPAFLDQVQTQWQRARRHRRWVETLHRHLHAAAVLRSCELLEVSLREADAVGYTDAAVDVARRAVASLKDPKQRKRGVLASEATSRSPLLSSSMATLNVGGLLDRGQRPVTPPESSENAKDARRDAVVLSVLHATETEEPVDPEENAHAADERESNNDTVNSSAACIATDASTALLPDNADIRRRPKLEEVVRAMEAVAHAAEDIPPSLPNAKAALQQLYAATVALADAAISDVDAVQLAATSSSTPDEKATHSDHICVTPENPFCAPYLLAWKAVLQHQVRPSGILIKSPRSVWDLVRDMGAENTDGDYAAPYVTRLSSDFQRLYRSTEDSEAARQRTDVVLLSLVLFTHRMTCVWDGMLQLGDKGRRELLLPDSLMAHAEVVRALLAAARVCDSLRWKFANVQALAVECLFPRRAVDVPIPQRFSAPARTVDASAALADPAQKESNTQKERPQEQKVTPSRAGAPLRSVSFVSTTSTPPSVAGEPTYAPQATAEARVQSAEALREEYSEQVLQRLREAVHDIAAYFTRQVRTQSTATTVATSAFFDEHCYPEAGALVESSLLPALVMLFSCGLVRRYQMVRTRTLWDVLVALREGLATSSRTLAAAEVVPIMDVVEALTATSDAHGRSKVKLRSLSDEQVDELRVRVFLRECMNRRQLHPLVCALFPPLNGNEEWVSEGTGTLWTLYNPSLCLLYPPDATPSAQLRPLLEKLSALPFVLIPDRELR